MNHYEQHIIQSYFPQAITNIDKINRIYLMKLYCSDLNREINIIGKKCILEGTEAKTSNSENNRNNKSSLEGSAKVGQS